MIKIFSLVLQGKLLDIIIDLIFSSIALAMQSKACTVFDHLDSTILGHGYMSFGVLPSIGRSSPVVCFSIQEAVPDM